MIPSNKTESAHFTLGIFHHDFSFWTSRQIFECSSRLGCDISGICSVRPLPLSITVALANLFPKIRIQQRGLWRSS